MIRRDRATQAHTTRSSHQFSLFRSRSLFSSLKMPPTIKRTYSSRQNRNPYPSSPVSALSSSPASPKRKRALNEYTANASNATHPPSKRIKLSEIAKGKKPVTKQKSLTQLHFCIDQPVLRTCVACGLSYTKGAPDDEALHRAHCSRVQRGMEWGREEDKESIKSGVIEVGVGIKLKDGRKGRIICFRADVGGKIGSKVRYYAAIKNMKLKGDNR